MIFKKILIKYRYLFYILFLVTPSVIWIFLDKSVWPWDQSDYGKNSIDLFYTLIQSPKEWIHNMLVVSPIKAPGIVWFGQFFVPLGKIIGYDDALMILITIMQIIILFFVYKIVYVLTKDKKISTISILILAAAPLFIGIGHQYLVEMPQLLATTFFIYILVVGHKWQKYDQTIAIVTALSYAMLIKISSPLYLFLPSIFIIVNIYKTPSVPIKTYFYANKIKILYWLLGIILFVLTSVWYVVNGTSIINFMYNTSSGPISMYYGEKLTFLNKLFYWFEAAIKNFFTHNLILYLITIMFFFVMFFIIKKKRFLNKEVNLIVIISMLSITIAIIIFSFQINDEVRFLLPLFIYFVLIIICFIHYMGNKIITNIIFLLFLFQFLYANSFALGIINNSRQKFSYWLIPVQKDIHNKKIVESIIEKTCIEKKKGQISVVGVNYSWLNLLTLNYYASQMRSFSKFGCRYMSFNYAETDASKFWKEMTEYIKPSYFISVSEELYQPEPDYFNVISFKTLKKVKKSKFYSEEDIQNITEIQLFKGEYSNK